MRKQSASNPERTTATRHLLHEVRTPIGQIIGYAEMVEEAATELGHPELAEDLVRIRAAARKLLAYLEGLFLADGREPPGESEVPPSAAEESAVAAPTSGAAGSILLVDDDAGQRDLLARRLTRAGYGVTQASRGRDALHLLQPGGFDLVLLDVQMPEMDGLAVLDAIRRTSSVSELPVVMATALGGREDVMAALERGANDYVTKPFDYPVVMTRVATQMALVRGAREITELASELELRNAFIRQTFGRYVSDEIVDELLDAPAALEIRGEQRRISVLFCDLSGFTPMTQSLPPRDTVSVLNGFLDEMTKQVQSHGGTVDEIMGDGLLAFFGAPIAHENASERAVAAALAMQCAVPELNARHRRSGLPEIGMTVGIATGDVIVGNIGSKHRVKYGAVGSPVNLAARIESHAVTGEVLIDPTTYTTLAEILEIGDERETLLKGFEAPVALRRVVAIGGRHPRRLPEAPA